MSKWEMVKLGDVCSFVNGDRGTNYPSRDVRTTEGVPFINAGHLHDKKIDVNNLEYIPRTCFDLLGSGKFSRGDILFCLRGSLGKYASVGELPEGSIASSLVIVRPGNAVIEGYILAYFGSAMCATQILLHKNGAAQPNLSAGRLSDFLLPLPPLVVQQKIAQTLDVAAELIALRKKQLAELDNLIKATFYDMFGNPATNPKGWDVCTWGDNINMLTDYHANGSYKILKKHVELLDSPNYAYMVRTTDIENQNYIQDVKYITKDAYNFLDKTKVYGGEIIINKIGSAGKIYLMPYLNRPVSLGMNQFMVRFNESVNNNFLFYYSQTNYCQKNINNRINGAVTKTITKDSIRSIPMYIPPLTLQNQFAEIVTKIEEQKALVQKAIDESQYLFDSLMSEYFE